MGIRIECSGKFSVWEKNENQMQMKNSALMRTQTSTKGGRYQTNETIFQTELMNQTTNCPVLSKKEISTPHGVGIVVTIDQCEDLEKSNLEQLCETKVQSYCHDNLDSQVLQTDLKDQSLDGTCNVTEVEQINTCCQYK